MQVPEQKCDAGVFPRPRFCPGTIFTPNFFIRSHAGRLAHYNPAMALYIFPIV
jgi:hypothetical protein